MNRDDTHDVLSTGSDVKGDGEDEQLIINDSGTSLIGSSTRSCDFGVLMHLDF